MAVMCDYFRNKFLDFVFRQQAFTPPTTLYVALNTTNASHAVGSGIEVSGGSYARVSYTSSLAQWAGTQSSGSTTVSSGTGSTAVTSNNAVITFPAPTAGWGTVVGFTIWDASSGGNMLFFGALASSKTVNSGDAQPSFSIGALALTFDV
jgi:hypothetical protein